MQLRDHPAKVGRIVVDYSTPPVIEQFDEQPIPLKWQLAAFALACATCGGVGFAWAWLMFGVTQ